MYVTTVLDDRAFSWYSTELGDWYAFPGEYEISAGASSRDIRMTANVKYETERSLPVRIDYNTTIGQLLDNDKTREFGKRLSREMDKFFGMGEDDKSDTSAEAFNDEMAEAMAASQPIRGIINFGILSKDELDAEIAKYID